MTPERFRACLTALAWSQRGLSSVLNCDDRRVRRWASGEEPIPSKIAAWLETLAQAHEALPPPRVWPARHGPERNP